MPTVSISEESFPSLLKEAKGAPTLLYYEGQLEVCQKPTISVIGSRKMSLYGEKVLRLFIPSLVRAGLVIVSGLAYGIDSYAHRVTLEQNGLGIVVLGSGLDVVYPSANRSLFESLLKKGGCAFSEYPPGTQPAAYHFPARNRIVSGLSPVVLIIEAGENSGTLITASCALEQGHEVLIVPGDITRPQSQGINRLLRQGAQCVTCAEEVLSFYTNTFEKVYPQELRPALTGSLATLYDLISRGEETVDHLLKASGLAIPELQSILSVLELDGYIYSKGDQWLKT